MNQITKIANYQKASYSALHVLTHEENRFILELSKIRGIDPSISIHEWDVQYGLTYTTGPEDDAQKAQQQRFDEIEKARDEEEKQTGTRPPSTFNEQRIALPSHPTETKNTVGVIEYIQKYKAENCLFVLKDFHLHFDNKQTIRMLRNAWNILKSRGNMIIFVGHKFALPGEIQKEVQLIDYTLPDEQALQERLEYIHNSLNHGAAEQDLVELTPEIKEAAVEAAKGMTSVEAENAFAMGWSTVHKLDNKFVEVVFQEKIAQLKKSGLLTYMEPNISFDNVGGMQGLKSWLTARKKAYSKDARNYHLPMPKGMLLASVPGTGKSLICKAIAKEFDCPLFALDIGSVFDSLVGNSEKNMREIIKTVESIGKCVILIDEIEKSLSNSAVSGSGDSGVSSRIFGTFLTWLNDRTNPAFIVATTNNHTLLPAALIRKGRFDQLFWVDLPTSDERRDIFNVVIKKYNRDPRDFSMKTLVEGSKDFTGAEIEEVFKDAMYKAFEAGQEVSDQHVTDVLADFIPFAQSHEEDLKTMRRQAQGKLMMVTSKGDPIADVQKNLRKLSIAIGNEQ
jgi:ATP-dependent 26S proteasome regulatory subunit